MEPPTWVQRLAVTYAETHRWLIWLAERGAWAGEAKVAPEEQEDLGGRGTNQG